MKASDRIKIQAFANNGIQIRHSLKKYLGVSPLTERIKIKFINNSRNTRLVLLISDRMIFLMIETKDQYKKKKNNMGISLNGVGLASLSKSESTVNSYFVILENLWIQSIS
jgi:hypothetical protein